MKKFLFLLVLFSILFTACGTKTPVSEPPMDDPTPPTEEPKKTVRRIHPDTLSPTRTYVSDDNSVLNSYEDQEFSTFSGLFRYYMGATDYTLHSTHRDTDLTAATFTKGSELVHMYWEARQKSLNVVFSETGAVGLPDANTELPLGLPTAITQLYSWRVNEMGYVIRLSDGSFLVIDGGNDTATEELMDTLRDQSFGNQVHIRTWLITHSHSDHYGCFHELSSQRQTYEEKFGIAITLDTVMIAPVHDHEALAADPEEGHYLSRIIHEDMAAWQEASLCYVHTGMRFHYGPTRLDILFTGNDLYIDQTPPNLNDSSIVFRISSTLPNEKLNMLVLGDAGEATAKVLLAKYGENLQSDLVQTAHHGVEDFPLYAYEVIQPSILFYPCSNPLYEANERFGDVRKALRESPHTKEILIFANDRYTRFLNANLNPIQS